MARPLGVVINLQRHLACLGAPSTVDETVGWGVSFMAQPRLDEHSVCGLCGDPIQFDGDQWWHVDAEKVRAVMHFAGPGKAPPRLQKRWDAAMTKAASRQGEG